MPEKVLIYKAFYRGRVQITLPPLWLPPLIPLIWGELGENAKSYRCTEKAIVAQRKKHPEQTFV